MTVVMASSGLHQSTRLQNYLAFKSTHPQKLLLSKALALKTVALKSTLLQRNESAVYFSKRVDVEHGPLS